jgi:hypothetical protein
LAAAPLKRFDQEWIFDAFTGHPTFFTKRMFGGLAAYLHERQMLVLVEPTKTGRWKWHGVLVCTGREHHASIRRDVEATMEAVASGREAGPSYRVADRQPRSAYSVRATSL